MGKIQSNRQMPTKQTRINRSLILAPVIAAALYGRFAPSDSAPLIILAGVVIGALIVIAEKYIKK